MNNALDTSGLLNDSSRRNFLKLAGVMGAAAAFAGTISACSPGGSPAPAGSAAAAEGTGSIEAGISYQLSTGFDPWRSCCLVLPSFPAWRAASASHCGSSSPRCGS